MSKILLLCILFISSLNAGFIFKTPRSTPIKAVPSSDKCYTREIARDTQTPYTQAGTTKYYCKDTFVESPSDSYIKADICTGATSDAPSSVVFSEKAWHFNLRNCSDINLTSDTDGNEIVYYGGIPYDKTAITNGLYFNPYDGLLICQSSYLQINNTSCIKPNYNLRNLADAIIKRDKIARDNNLSDVSSIQESNITYNATTGAIESFSFTATNSSGASEVIATSFTEDDKEYTVEEDGTVTEADYVPDTSGGTDTGTGGTDTGGGDTGSGSSGGTSPDTVALDKISSSNDSIDSSLKDINNTLNPDTLPSLDNPLENVDTFYDTSIIPEVQDMVTNFSNDFYNLKDTYTNKIAYIQENGFDFDYNATLYETCPLNYELTVLENQMEINFDVCKMMSDAMLPNTNINMLVMFHTIFYTFFYAVILLGIFNFAVLTLRSF